MNAVYLFFEWKLLLTTNFDFFSLRYHCHPELLSIISIPIVVVQLLSRVWLRDPMDCRTPGSSVFHCLPEFAQIHVDWVSNAIQLSSSVAHFSPCPQSFPETGSFPVSRLFTSGGQSIGALASASILPTNIPGWFPLGWTGLISLQC